MCGGELSWNDSGTAIIRNSDATSAPNIAAGRRKAALAVRAQRLCNTACGSLSLSAASAAAQGLCESGPSHGPPSPRRFASGCGRGGTQHDHAMRSESSRYLIPTSTASYHDSIRVKLPPRRPIQHRLGDDSEVLTAVVLILPVAGGCTSMYRR